MIAQWRCKLCVGLMIATTLGSAPLMFQGRAWAEANVDSPFSWSKGSLIAQGIPPSSLTTQSLSGRWRCNDGGTYYLNQVGNTLWWYGESAEDGAFWTNVFHGTIQGNRIVGEWSDVPSGRSNAYGELELQIDAVGQLRVIRKTGGFGGSIWLR